MEYVSTQNCMRCASKQCINNLKTFLDNKCSLITFEAKKSINIYLKPLKTQLVQVLFFL